MNANETDEIEDDDDDTGQQPVGTGDRLAALERKLVVQGLRAELHVDEKSAAAIAELQARAGGALDARECLAILKQRSGGNEGSGYDESQHRVLGAGRPPSQPNAFQTDAERERADWDRRKALVKKLRDSDSIAEGELRNNMIGSLAASVLGLPFRKTRID